MLFLITLCYYSLKIGWWICYGSRLEKFHNRFFFLSINFRAVLQLNYKRKVSENISVSTGNWCLHVPMNDSGILWGILGNSNESVNEHKWRMKKWYEKAKQIMDRCSGENQFKDWGWMFKWEVDRTNRIYG